MTILEDNPPKRDGIREEVQYAASVLFESDDVVELRAFKSQQVVSGYFSDHEALVETAAALDEEQGQIFVTVNPVSPELLPRADNNVVARPAATTADHDVVVRRWLLVDVDPVRPASVCATQMERRAAFERTKAVRAYLREVAWPKPVIADSGNGFHLLYRVDLPNDQESRELVKKVLESLALRFDDEHVKIDTSVHNAARIVRFYGTTNRKGANTPERRWRRSKISKTPKEV